jgi:hypothetical protein
MEFHCSFCSFFRDKYPKEKTVLIVRTDLQEATMVCERCFFYFKDHFRKAGYVKGSEEQTELYMVHNS